LGIRKRVGITLTSLVLLAVASPALACPVCFGNPNSAMTKGTQAGIFALLLVTVAMLGAFGGFFMYLRRRIRLFEESNGGSY
jgi:hypothetical protein